MLKFLRHRRRTRPITEPVRISPHDAIVASWHGYTEDEWAELPSLVRVDKRESHAQAAGIGS